MSADRISFAALLTPFEETILRLAAAEEGLDPGDPETLVQAVVRASRRVVARSERAGLRVRTGRALFDELVPLCFAHACDRSRLERGV